MNYSKRYPVAAYQAYFGFFIICLLVLTASANANLFEGLKKGAEKLSSLGEKTDDVLGLGDDAKEDLESGNITDEDALAYITESLGNLEKLEKKGESIMAKLNQSMVPLDLASEGATALLEELNRTLLLVSEAESENLDRLEERQIEFFTTLPESAGIDEHVTQLKNSTLAMQEVVNRLTEGISSVEIEYKELGKQRREELIRANLRAAAYLKSIHGYTQGADSNISEAVKEFRESMNLLTLEMVGAVAVAAYIEEQIDGATLEDPRAIGALALLSSTVKRLLFFKKQGKLIKNRQSEIYGYARMVGLSVDRAVHETHKIDLKLGVIDLDSQMVMDIEKESLKEIFAEDDERLIELLDRIDGLSKPMGSISQASSIAAVIRKNLRDANDVEFKASLLVNDINLALADLWRIHSLELAAQEWSVLSYGEEPEMAAPRERIQSLERPENIFSPQGWHKENVKLSSESARSQQTLASGIKACGQLDALEVVNPGIKRAALQFQHESQGHLIRLAQAFELRFDDSVDAAEKELPEIGEWLELLSKTKATLEEVLKTASANPSKSPLTVEEISVSLSESKEIIKRVNNHVTALKFMTKRRAAVGKMLEAIEARNAAFDSLGVSAIARLESILSFSSEAESVEVLEEDAVNAVWIQGDASWDEQAQSITAFFHEQTAEEFVGSILPSLDSHEGYITDLESRDEIAQAALARANRLLLVLEEGLSQAYQTAKTARESSPLDQAFIDTVGVSWKSDAAGTEKSVDEACLSYIGARNRIGKLAKSFSREIGNIKKRKPEQINSWDRVVYAAAFARRCIFVSAEPLKEHRQKLFESVLGYRKLSQLAESHSEFADLETASINNYQRNSDDPDVGAFAQRSKGIEEALAAIEKMDSFLSKQSSPLNGAAESLPGELVELAALLSSLIDHAKQASPSDVEIVVEQAEAHAYSAWDAAKYEIARNDTSFESD